MLQDIFVSILNMSITASYAALFVFALRLLLRKAPKGISYAMWSVVLLRAVCPVSFSSAVSLLGRIGTVHTAAASATMRYIPTDIGMREAPAVNVGIPDVNNAINESLPAATPAASVNSMQAILAAAAIVWLIGCAAMLIYSVVSYLALKRRLSTAVRIDGNVYESDRIPTAFVCGFLRPGIYLPAGLDETGRTCILAHEAVHIQRRDYLVKPIAFLALSLHWFNPLMWAAYFLMGKDMEMSCDERALKTIGPEEKVNYSTALLTLSAGRRIIAGSPLAFKESSAKARVKNVLHYKKPAFWLVVAAIAAAAAAGVSLLANPKALEKPEISFGEITTGLAWNDETGIRTELSPGDLQTLCGLVSAAKDSARAADSPGTAAGYGIALTVKNGAGVTIGASQGNIVFQRGDASWVLDDAALERFVGDACGLGGVSAREPARSPAIVQEIPPGFVANEAGATDAEISAVFAVVRNSLPVESMTGQGMHLYIYARQAWRGGALLLAGVSPRGEESAELYFVRGGGLVMHTRGSDCWSINYTHYEDETIVFGESFAWDNGPLATDEALAEFWNGETVTAEMAFTPNGEGDITRGFICTTPSITWLKSLAILKNGKTVVDDRSGQFTFDPKKEPWYGQPQSIRNRTRYVWPAGAPRTADVMKFFGGFPAVMVETGDASRERLGLTHWPDCLAHSGVSPDIWHSNNGLYGRATVTAGSAIAAEILTAADDPEERRKVSDLAVSNVYWVDLSIDDDGKCISEGGLAAPVKKGYYVLILVTEYGCFSQMLQVV